MQIEIRPQPFAPWQEVSRYEESHLAPGSFGACAMFVGSTRDFNQVESVSRLTIEHYPGMTERQLHQLAEQAMQQYALLDGLLLHRIGELHPNEPIVVVATWAAHRADAFNACRDIMEMLKSRATFWKKESVASSERWVESNTPG